MGDLPTRSLAVQRTALESGALIPLQTELLPWPEQRFQLRRLISATPKHLAKAGPKPNPFRPWDSRLQVAELEQHVVLLNKYPVQAGHLLLISKTWQAQSDWLQPTDWSAVLSIWNQQPGFWFFNSTAAAGASQPHRHLQLLPRELEAPACPLAAEFEALAAGNPPTKPWHHAVAVRQLPADRTGPELDQAYRDLASELALGDHGQDMHPVHPYNLLVTDHWMAMVRRRIESHAGFSVNALGFAGYLLATKNSNLDWLRTSGGDALLDLVSL
tara:strand:- start:622 stop:1437 length:816 start_codon:yes stop_codon:yes gene_type:complete